MACIIVYPIDLKDWKSAMRVGKAQLVRCQTDAEAQAAVRAVHACDQLSSGLLAVVEPDEVGADVDKYLQELENVNLVIGPDMCEVIAIRENHGKLSYHEAVSTGASVYAIASVNVSYTPLRDIYEAVLGTIEATGADPLMLFVKVFKADSFDTRVCPLKPLLHALEQRVPRKGSHVKS